MFSYCLLYHMFDFKLYYLLYPYHYLISLRSVISNMLRRGIFTNFKIYSFSVLLICFCLLSAFCAIFFEFLRTGHSRIIFIRKLNFRIYTMKIFKIIIINSIEPDFIIFKMTFNIIFVYHIFSLIKKRGEI